MAASHPLTGIARYPEGTARWALGRMAAAAAEDIRFDAVAESTQHRVPQDVAGRYGAHSTVRFESSVPEPAVRETLDDASTAELRQDVSIGVDPCLALTDPARLIGAVAAATDGRLTWYGERPTVDIVLTPDPESAAPDDPWLPPGAGRLAVTVDVRTGMLLRARVFDAHGCFRSGELRLTRSSADTGPVPASYGTGAGSVLARMATSRLDPVRLRAEVDAEPGISEPLTPASLPSRRRWTVTVHSPGTTLTTDLSGDYRSDQAAPAAARLAELLTPARIVSHLAHATPAGPDSLHATVRPLRAFPLSAWAPEEGLTCEFTIDPTTGILLRARTADASSRTLFRCDVRTHHRV
ncbi:hypothetical protein ACH4A8_37380 [Streptomyces vietnamensis]|uniref:hypothetical protein n=1 Tax=Streptomyces vietnamensis TaxID=362257 RepID=UPI0037A26EC3